MVLAALLALAGVAMAASTLAHILPQGLWWPALLRPDPARVAEVLAADSVLPRLAMALLCGAALGLAGALAQVALRNPLAAPDTLGVASGGQLALSAATLYAPNLLAVLGRGPVAAAGGTAGLLAVLALTVRGGLRPAPVALAGLAVALYLGSAGNVLAVLHTRQLSGMFLWSAGSLVQLGWSEAVRVAAVLLFASTGTFLLRRPLRLLDLPDGMASGLGVPVPVVRLLALCLSVLLAAAVAGTVGTVGFLGLLAPSLARAAGGPFLLASPLVGAGLLAAADGVTVRLADWMGAPLQTGAVTAMAGLPLLLWLLVRTRPGAGTAGGRPPAVLPVFVRRASHPRFLLLLAGAAVAALAVAASLLGPGPDGWAAGTFLLHQRIPRAGAAAVAGVLLGLAGTLLQRVLGNPMASPEVLGLSTGTAAGMVAALWLGEAGTVPRFGAGLLGAACVLLLLLPLNRGPNGRDRLPIAGIALSASASGGLALLLASGDPRADVALSWLSGSTYGIGPDIAGLAAVAGTVLLLPVFLLLRPLELLALGEGAARGLGMRVGMTQAALLAGAASLTTTATLLVGPLSFVGLMAPHLARLAGLTRPGTEAAGAALAGAFVMLAADWFGRTALFPYEVPAGLAASLLGGPVLALALARRNT